MSSDQDRFPAALDALPQLLRIVFLLHARDGFDFAAIGFRIGEDARQVERHFAEGLKALGRHLDGR